MLYRIVWGMEQRWRYQYFLQSILDGACPVVTFPVVTFPVVTSPVETFPVVTFLVETFPVDSFQDVPWAVGVHSYYWGVAASAASSHWVVATFEIAAVGIAFRHRAGVVPFEMTHREEEAVAAAVVEESLPVAGSSLDWAGELD